MMREGKRVKGKHFAYVLKDLMNKTGVKNSSLATALQYDISYVSKWTNGSNLPATKFYEDIITSISECLVGEIEEKSLPTLLGSFGAEDRKGLCKLWQTLLLEAYERDRSSGRTIQKNNKTNPFCYYPMISLSDAVEEIKETFPGGRKLIIVSDVLGMDHESMLHFIGAEDGMLFSERALGSRYSDIELLLSIPENIEDKENIEYDFLGFMHLICALSHVKSLKIYVSNVSKGKILVVDSMNGISSAVICLGDTTKGFFYLSDTNIENAHHMEKEISILMTQSSLAFSNFSFHEMLKNMEYVKTCAAPEAKWIIGHITEMFMSGADMKDILSDFNENQNMISGIIMQENLDRLEKALRTVDIDILIYESAIADFIMSGIVDIFNIPVQLSVDARKRCIKTIISYLDRTNINIRLIRGGFAKDFKRTPNPCMFSSSLGACLRIENGTYKNNIYSNPNAAVKKFIETAFQKLWNRKDVVLKDKETITSILESYEKSCEVFR